MGCKLKDYGLFCCLFSLQFNYFSNSWVSVFFSRPCSSNDVDNTGVKINGQPFSIHFRLMTDHLPLLLAIWPATRSLVQSTVSHVLNNSTLMRTRDNFFRMRICKSTDNYYLISRLNASHIRPKQLGYNRTFVPYMYIIHSYYFHHGQ